MTSKPMCQTRGCMREAACLGAYEGAAEKTYACNGCCGHGNEDGHCEPVDTIQEREQRSELASLREQARTLSAANETLRETVRKREAAEIEAAAEADELREQVRTLTAERDEARREAEAQSAMVEAWSDALGLEKSDGYDKAEEVREERDALRARVVELEVALTMQERARVTLHDEAQVLRAEVATARDAALEEAAQHLFRRSAEIRAEAETTTPQLAALKDARSLVAGERLNMGHELRALKTQPARRFVDVSDLVKILRYLRDHMTSWDRATVEEVAMRCRITPTEMGEVKETGRARHVCGWNGDPCTTACPAHEVKP